MVLRIIKSNHQFNYLLLVLFGLALWSASLIKPELYMFFDGEEKNILFYPIYNLLKNFAIVNVITSLFLALTLSILIQQINSQYSIIHEKNKLPALIFIIMAGGLTGIHTLHSVYFAGIFLVIAIYQLFSTFEQIKPYSASFNSGFLLGIGSLFYLNLLLLIPAFILSIGILGRENNWRIFVIQLIGTLLPFIFVFSYGVFTAQFFEIFEIFEQNFTTPNSYLKTNLVLQAYLGFLILLFIISIIAAFQHYDTKKISSRKFFSVFFLIFIFSTAGLVFLPSTSQEMLIIVFIPVSYIISNLFTDFKSRFWNRLIFLLLLAAVVFLQIIALQIWEI